MAMVLIAIVGLSVVAYAHNVFAPSGRRWATFEGMVVQLFGMDAQGYRIAVNCTVTQVDNGNGTHLNCLNIGK